MVNEGCSTDWPAFLARGGVGWPTPVVLVVGGCVPDGVPAAASAALRLGRSASRAARGRRHERPALLAALAAAPWSSRTSPSCPTSPTSPTPCGGPPLASISGVVVAVTLGAEGIVLAVGGEVWHGSAAACCTATPPAPVMRCWPRWLAAMRAGLRSWPEVLHDAVALSGAAVLAPYAGEFDPRTTRSCAQVSWSGALEAPA